MNSDQKMIATMGLILILFVVFGVYRKTISAILFNAPPQNTNIGPNLLGPLSGLVSNPVPSATAPPPTDHTNGASTNQVPGPQSTVTVGPGIKVLGA